jgi:ABC-type phosphate/phosphonate transport system ATPase subunit
LGTKAKGQGEHLALIGLSGASKTTTLIKACEGIQTPILYLTIKDADTAPPNWEAYKLSLKRLGRITWLNSPTSAIVSRTC